MVADRADVKNVKTCTFCHFLLFYVYIRKKFLFLIWNCGWNDVDGLPILGVLHCCSLVDGEGGAEQP